jgi:HEAT repeat protein
MRTIERTALRASLGLLLTAPLLLSTSLRAHGGQYRGPSSVVPPSSSGSTSGGNQFRGPGDVLPGGGNPLGGGAGSSPTSRPSGRGAAAAAGAAGARGVPVGDDLGRWEFWWEFGKDPFLNLRETIYREAVGDDGQSLWNPRLASRRRDIRPPNANDLRQVASQLAATLSSSNDRDTSSACIVALAKIGSQRAGFDLADLLQPLLERGDQELRETAAVAFGISGDLGDETIAIVTALVRDSAEGRRLSDRHEVDHRTRAFAAYGAGLLLHRSRKPATSMRLVRALTPIVANAEQHDRNLVVAAIEALALFPTEWTGAAPETLRTEIVATLGAYYQRALGVGDQLIQAHVPTALARLLPRASREAEVWRDRFAADLRGGLRSRSSASGAKVNHHIAQSCAMALGTLCEPWNDANSPSHDAGQLLVEVYRDHRDQQTRSFATLALARIGGDRARTFLLGELAQANKAIEQPWLAVSLGVIAARQRAANTHQGADADAYLAVTEALIEQFEEARNPSTVGAIAIALGLTGTGDARDVLRARLVKHHKRDAVAGYVALALGLLQDNRAIKDLREVRKDATRRPFVLLQTVRSLGLLGDHTLTDQLIAELQGSGQSLVRLSATAAALAQIGDRRCLPALRGLLANEDVTPLTRAFAAVALGGVCDKDPLPWNAAYATQVNYRAATETLTDGGSGILDLL